MTIFLFYFLFLFFRFAPYIIFDFVRYMLICSVCSYFHIFFGFNLVLLKSNLMSNISVYNLIWRISSKLLQYVYIFHCEIDLLFLRNIFFFFDCLVCARAFQFMKRAISFQFWCWFFTHCFSTCWPIWRKISRSFCIIYYGNVIKMKMIYKLIFLYQIEL